MESIILAIKDGGVWMAPIIISFVFALAIMAERAMVIFGAKSNQAKLMATVRKHYSHNSLTVQFVNVLI